MSKEKQIRKVTLSSEGLKGLIIEGTLETVKENRMVMNGFKDTVKHPIHLLLEDKIKDLRFHALNIAGLIVDDTKKEEKLSLIGGCNVLSFEVGSDSFVIKVESRVFDTKYIKFSTPKVDSSDGYEFFDEVNTLLSEILVEVHAYMKGLKKITDEEIAFMYIRHGKDKSVDADMFSAFTNEEKQEYCKRIIEELGGVVIINEDVSEVELSEEVLELPPIAEPIKLKA